MASQKRRSTNCKLCQESVEEHLPGCPTGENEMVKHVERSDIVGIFGVLNVLGGVDIDLEARNEIEAQQLITNIKRDIPMQRIVDFGTEELGSEAHNYIQIRDGSDLVLDTLEDVREFWRKL